MVQGRFLRCSVFRSHQNIETLLVYYNSKLRFHSRLMKSSALENTVNIKVYTYSTHSARGQLNDMAAWKSCKVQTVLHIHSD